jgi:hypothetical protein
MKVSPAGFGLDENADSRAALRIEWARTRALGLRNTEEVDILEEEMRRTPVYLYWRADWWEGKKDHSGDTQRPDLLSDPQQMEGHDAYTMRQARILRTIATRFESKWVGMPAELAAGRAEVAVAERVAAAARAAEEEDSSEAEEDATEEEEADNLRRGIDGRGGRQGGGGDMDNESDESEESGRARATSRSSARRIHTQYSIVPIWNVSQDLMAHQK